MKEYPILFSGEMVRAILDGRKTQTRRVVKMPPFDSSDESLEIYATINLDKCPYGQVGDRLWVRETFMENPQPTGYPYLYRADDQTFNHPEWEKWKPLIHMPREASRITLEITDVRVERLQDISEEDCLNEGIEPSFMWTGVQRYRNYAGEPCDLTPILSFMSLWKSINGKGSWDLNPWVWVIEFKQI